MRNANTELINEINNASEYRCCDLYSLALRDGSTYYIASYDVDVVYSQHTYQHDFLMINRSDIKLSGEPAVDSLSVTIFADRVHEDTINDRFIMKAAHDGVFENAYLTLSRAFFDNENNIIGVLELFSGRCEIASCTGFACKLTVKSEITGLAGMFPPRIFAPQNSYSEDSNGQVVTSSSDAHTCCIPLKPSQNVLVRFG